MRLPAQLLRRKINANKRDFGHVFILAGSRAMLGAAALTAMAALRSGAGLVTVGVTESLSNILQKKVSNEVMTLALPETSEGSIDLSSFSKIKKFLKKVDCLAIGPGLSRNVLTQKLIRKIIQEIDKPMVIDADALNALVGNLKLLQAVGSRQWAVKILTPHPGEMVRLLGISVNAVQKNRIKIAHDFAKKYHCVLVLKGNKTVVANSTKTYVNSTGNPGMATAGSGDVLTGIISAFLCQGLKPFDAAKYGVYLHGLCGDLAAKEKTEISLIASDIIEKIPEAIKKCS